MGCKRDQSEQGMKNIQQPACDSSRELSLMLELSGWSGN